eukprot:gene11270-7834_t
MQLSSFIAFKGIAQLQDSDSTIQRQLMFLVRSWAFVIPFVINQCGSIFFALSMAENPLSTVSIVVNALSFLTTALVDAILGRRVFCSWNMLLGSLLILFGAHMTILGSTASLEHVTQLPYSSPNQDL